MGASRSPVEEQAMQQMQQGLPSARSAISVPEYTRLRLRQSDLIEELVLPRLTTWSVRAHTPTHTLTSLWMP